jgi:hypothetical protein
MTMTTRSILPLALALAGLGFGCTDKPDPKEHELPAKQEVAQAQPEPMPMLTATAPAQPASITDGPSGEKKQPEPPKAEPLGLGVQEITHDDEPSVETDYDRPVDARDVRVDRFVLATDVKGREPVDESDSFPHGTQQIFAFVQLSNQDAPYAFEVHFEPVDGPRSQYGVKLNVPTATRYRTWAWTRIQREPGSYRAVLRTLEGEEIASREFVIEPVQE